MLINMYLEMDRLSYKTQYLIQDILIYKVLSEMNFFLFMYITCVSHIQVKYLIYCDSQII